MNATAQTTIPRPASALSARTRGASERHAGGAEGPVLLYRVALAAILGLSAAMNVYDLSRNGWANTFYSAGVKSMLLSLHNFLFISFDPGGLISLDKPPLAVWVMAISAKIFGFTPMSLLLPEAIAGVLCVWVLYMAMARPFGRLAALIAALCLAVFPAFVAVNRDNNPDALLILLMTVSCWIALKAIQSGRLRTIVLCGFFVALAFNTKTLAAYLVVPGIAAGYLVCAPGPLRSRMIEFWCLDRSSPSPTRCANCRDRREPGGPDSERDELRRSGRRRRGRARRPGRGDTGADAAKADRGCSPAGRHGGGGSDDA